jgi:hypothetical protein
MLSGSRRLVQQSVHSRICGQHGLFITRQGKGGRSVVTTHAIKVCVQIMFFCVFEKEEEKNGKQDRKEKI